MVLFALGLKTTLGDVGEALDTVPGVGVCCGADLYLVAHVAFIFRTTGRVFSAANLRTSLERFGSEKGPREPLEGAAACARGTSRRERSYQNRTGAVKLTEPIVGPLDAGKLEDLRCNTIVVEPERIDTRRCPSVGTRRRCP